MRFVESDDEKIAFFCEGRSKQPDEDFIAACALPSDPEAARVAVAVRRAVAEVGSIDPEWIRAEDVYPDQLGVLPLWDSMDWLSLFLALERELKTKISNEEADQLLDPRGFSVREMAAAVYRMIKSRA
jgi:acyl carrier protein